WKLGPARALVRAEEDQLVAYGQPAGCSGELSALEAIVFARAVGKDSREWAGRVEMAIADELEGGPGNPVGARLGHRTDTGARVHPVLGREAARRHPEFLKRIGERQRQVGVALRVVVRRTVQRVRHAEWQAARDRDVHATGH